MIFSKRHILFIATVTILFATISEGRVVDRVGSGPTVSDLLTWMVDKIWDRNGDHGNKTEAVSNATCQACLINQAALDKHQEGQLRSLASNIHNVTVFSEDPDSPVWKDPRTTMDQDGNPQLNAIGIIEVSGTLSQPPRPSRGKTQDIGKTSGGKYKGKGTGVKISRCLVLTDNHVAFLDQSPENITDHTINFYQRDKGPDGVYLPKLTKTSGKVVETADYQDTSKDDLKDWAIIKLDKSQQDEDGIIPPCILTQEQMEKFEKFNKRITVSSAAFYKDLAPNGDALWGQKKCKILDSPVEAGGAWRTTCPGIAGTSGAPVFTKNIETNRICALGIMNRSVAAGPKTQRIYDKEYNTMIPIFSSITQEKVKAIIEKYPCDEVAKPVRRIHL